MTLEEFEQRMKDIQTSVDAAVGVMDRASAQILAMQADWEAVYKVCRSVEGISKPIDLEKAIMEIGITARKYYNL